MWALFVDVSSSRSVGMGGVSGISYAELKAFSELYEMPLDPFEVSAIKALDRAYLARVAS